MSRNERYIKKRITPSNPWPTFSRHSAQQPFERIKKIRLIFKNILLGCTINRLTYDCYAINWRTLQCIRNSIWWKFNVYQSCKSCGSMQTIKKLLWSHESPTFGHEVKSSIPGLKASKEFVPTIENALIFNTEFI